MIFLDFFKKLRSQSFRKPDERLFRGFPALEKAAHQLSAKLFLLILTFPALAWLSLSMPKKQQEPLLPEKINLALRRTADALLRAAGDSTSRIPAIEQTAPNVWRVRLEKPFSYAQLPAQLQSSFDRHGIRQTYDVALRRCEDATIDLGYNQLDFLTTNPVKTKSDGATPTGEVACVDRTMPEGCHFIEVTFLPDHQKTPFWAGKTGILWLILGALAGYWFFRWQKPHKPVVAEPEKSTAADSTIWLEFGQARLDAAGQILLIGGVRQNLTFRETKLLRLFAENPDRLLERDFILQQVWADEGVLVGRSVDVFVSRLRKKLADDTSLGLVAVHGVGYRLEIRA